MTAAGIRVVLMDLGGVLLRLRDPLDAFGLQLPHHEFLQRWLLSPSVRALECGRISADEFAAAAVVEFELDYSSDEFLRRFRQWPDQLYDGIPAMLSTISDDYSLALLSNTNAIHWECDSIAGILEPLLDHAFLSYRTGLLKPDAAAFTDVLQHYGVAACNVLFVDDNIVNILAARALGFDARHTLGGEALLGHLIDVGVLSQSAAFRC